MKGNINTPTSAPGGSIDALHENLGRERYGELTHEMRLEKSKQNMKRLGEEYASSAALLEKRVRILKNELRFLPLAERKRLERRIELLECEIAESRRTGELAGGFYLPGHRFVPKRSRVSAEGFLC